MMSACFFFKCVVGVVRRWVGDRIDSRPIEPIATWVDDRQAVHVVGQLIDRPMQINWTHLVDLWVPHIELWRPNRGSGGRDLLVILFEYT
jgi:hypothetical protein